MVDDDEDYFVRWRMTNRTGRPLTIRTALYGRDDKLIGYGEPHVLPAGETEATLSKPRSLLANYELIEILPE